MARVDFRVLSGGLFVGVFSRPLAIGFIGAFLENPMLDIVMTKKSGDEKDERKRLIYFQKLRRDRERGMLIEHTSPEMVDIDGIYKDGNVDVTYNQDMGDADETVNVGYYYDEGIRVERMNKGIHLFSRVCSDINADGAHNLAEIDEQKAFEERIGVEKDEQKAFDKVEKDEQTAFNEGIGVGKDGQRDDYKHSSIITNWQRCVMLVGIWNWKE
ncbi:hypothetical protein F8M41_025768 [Gigaspora margarita]|uniref:Uncharacterized protein n=1 Tax=Gigaspora margarita TaxID=4874 RepID=A0A8H3XKI8_GIGMA|nr:hypothetical protein F8M41_025768 [Gigaspora margarita]